MHFRNYCILETRDGPLAPIQPADNQRVTETSSASPARSSPCCSQAGFSSVAKSTELAGAHHLISPNSSALPFANFAALIHACDFRREEKHCFAKDYRICDNNYLAVQTSPALRPNN